MTNEEFNKRIEDFTVKNIKSLDSEVKAIIKKYGKKNKDSMLLALAIDSHLASWYKTANENIDEIGSYLRLNKEGVALLIKRIHDLVHDNYLEGI